MRVLFVFLALLFFGCQDRASLAEVPLIQARVASDAVGDDPDDPAIWVNPRDPRASLVLGTNKAATPQGAIVVFGLNGKTKQTITGIDRPNNIDVEYEFPTPEGNVDIAVVTERYAHRLLLFRVLSDGSGLARIGEVPVFEGETGEYSEPMGISLYRRPGDGAIFAIVGRKNGPESGYLWQYRLIAGADGKVTGELVRKFGNYSGGAEIEAIAVDDESGFVYYADESLGIRKWAADPDAPNAESELAIFGREGFSGDREGIAIYRANGGRGYVICTDQLDGSSRYHVFRREGRGTNPHDHSEVVGVFEGGADSTDGVEVTSASLGAEFSKGIFVSMNSDARNFLFFDWSEIGRILGASPGRADNRN